MPKMLVDTDFVEDVNALLLTIEQANAAAGQTIIANHLRKAILHAIDIQEGYTDGQRIRQTSL